MLTAYMESVSYQAVVNTSQRNNINSTAYTRSGELCQGNFVAYVLLTVKLKGHLDFSGN